MSASTVYCHILKGNVTVITNVVCPKFYRITHGCDKKREGRGFLAGVLTKALDKAADTRTAYCEFGNPNHFLGNR